MNSVATKLTYQGIKQAIDYTLANYNNGRVQGYLLTYMEPLPADHPLKSSDGLKFDELLRQLKEIITGADDYAQNSDELTFATSFFYAELMQGFYGLQTSTNTKILPYIYTNTTDPGSALNRFGSGYKQQLIEDFFLLATIFSVRVYMKEKFKQWKTERRAIVSDIEEYQLFDVVYNIAKEDALVKEYTKTLVGLLGQKYAMYMMDEEATPDAEKLFNTIYKFGELIYGTINIDKLQEADIDQMEEWADDLMLNINIINSSSNTVEGKRNAILEDKPLNGIKYIVPETQYADYILDENEEPHSAEDIATEGHEEVYESHKQYVRIDEAVENVLSLIDKDTGKKYFPEDFAAKDHNHDNEGYVKIEDLPNIEARYILGEKITDPELLGILTTLVSNKTKSSIEYVDGLPYLSDKTNNIFYRVYTTEDFATIGHNHDNVYMQQTDTPQGAERFYDNINGQTYGMEDFALKGHTEHYDEDGNPIEYLSKEDTAVASFRLDGKEIGEFALEGHNHDERYYRAGEMENTFRNKNNITEDQKYVSGLNVYHDNGTADAIIPTQIRIGTKTLGPGESYLMPYDNIDFIHVTVVGDIEGGGLPIQGDDEEIYYDEHGIERKRRKIRISNPTNAYLTYNYLVTYKM